MGKIKKIQNHEYHVPEKSRENMDMENCVTKTEIDYILTNRPDIVTDVIVIKQVNVGSDHRLVKSNIKLDVWMERKK